MLEESYSGL